MTETVTALCNHCDYITDVVFKEKKHPNDIRETYFKCEHCFYHYTSFVTDKRVRKMQRQLQVGGRQNGKVKLFEDIKSRMSELKYNLINFLHL